MKREEAILSLVQKNSKWEEIKEELNLNDPQLLRYYYRLLHLSNYYKNNSQELDDKILKEYKNHLYFTQLFEKKVILI